MKKTTQSDSVRLGCLETSAQLRNGHVLNRRLFVNKLYADY
ncbi:MAG: hypothetical protein JWR38_2071 [Mucilaginibacter sp.]|nr:hypothetical protein [Mucilaginibacter sp.]